MQASYLVQTPFGKAKVVDVVISRSESSQLTSVDQGALTKYELELLDWTSSTTSAKRPRLYTYQTYPSISPRVGSLVVTVNCFQRPLHGRVLQVRPLDRIAVVSLYDWCSLDATSTDDPRSSSFFAKCYFSYNSIQVIDEQANVGRKRNSSVEKLLDILHHKTLGYQLYRAHKWLLAWNEFHRTSSLIAELLATNQKTLVRGNLMLHSIKCCNYMAVCKLWLNEQAACIKHCMDSLYLMNALEVKGKRRYRDFFGKYSGEIRVFGCWRIKSLQIMSHVFLEKKQYSAAKDLLKQAHKNAQKHQIPASNLAMERRVAQLALADRATLRLYTLVVRQLAGHKNAAHELPRSWLLEEIEEDAQWPPLPLKTCSTPTRRSRSEAKELLDSPDTHLTEATSFDTAENYSLADQESCGTQDTSDTAASLFRRWLNRNKDSSSVPALVPSDTNVYARDKKVFRARKQYLETVVKRNNLPGRTISITSTTSSLSAAPKSSSMNSHR